MKKKMIFSIFLLLFIFSYIINRVIYVGVIDNPFIYIFMIPIILNVYEVLNKRKMKITSAMNYVAIILMITSFVIGVPKYSYKQCKNEIIQKRFNGADINVTDLTYKQKRMKSFLRPSFLVNDFYRIEMKTENGEILNFYINPETGKWVEK